MITGVCLMCCHSTLLNSEHIIPQCLGGVLKDHIYCIECNSKFGMQADAELAKNYGRYATLMNIKRERGDNQPFSLTDENNGLQLKCDGEKFYRSKCIVDIRKAENGSVKYVEIIARTNEELKERSSSLAKKHNIELDSMIVDLIEHRPPYTAHDLYIGNDTIYKAIAKIAYGFACFKLPKSIVLSDSFSKVRSYLKGESSNCLVSANYTHTDFMTDNIRPLHKIHLSFNRLDRLIIGYVALFGVFRYTVLLSDCFTSAIEWPSVDYTYDPITQKEIPIPPTFIANSLTKDEVINPKNNQARVLDQLNRGMSMIKNYCPILESVHVETRAAD